METLLEKFKQFEIDVVDINIKKKNFCNNFSEIGKKLRRNLRKT